MNNDISNQRKLINVWNNRHRLDYSFRKKYNIPLFSKEHLEMSQVSIALDLLEDKIIRNTLMEYDEKALAKKKAKEDIEKVKNALKKVNFAKM